eukprot:m.1118953 g.1118953  ORF g.1118953 m.1118953 type:complete len:363 (-) comp24388_c0_seq7:2709-3797(-)
MAEADESCAVFHFEKPTLRIGNPMQIETFRASPARERLRGFIVALNAAVQSIPTNAPVPRSEAIDSVVELLDDIESIVDDCPPIENPCRFGNKAFKTVHERLTEEAENLLVKMLPGNLSSARIELMPYLLDAFGNPIRIDYGSGHELAFVAFLCCCALIGVFTAEDFQALVVVVFDKYLKLVRKIQTRYQQEPAGSHGVWGLDDHQFLCYVWGSSQLLHNADGVTPADIASENAPREYAEKYMFFDAIRYIYTVKSGPFFEHSKYLYDISSVPEWRKVNSGLLKMFDAEVLDKFPVIQHFFFGSLLTINLPEHVRPVAGIGAAAEGANLFRAPVPEGVAPWARGAVPAAMGVRPPPGSVPKR